MKNLKMLYTQIIKVCLVQALLVHCSYDGISQPTLTCPTCLNNELNACSGEALIEYMDITGEANGATYTVSGEVSNPGTSADFSDFILSDTSPFGTGSITVSVSSSNGNLAPIDIDINFVNIQTGFNYLQDNTPTCYTVGFTNSSFASPGFSIDAYSWNFGFSGANGTSSVANPTVTFPGPGQYIITLIATDNTYNCSASFTQTITIQGPVPVLTFTGEGVPLNNITPGDTTYVCFQNANVGTEWNLMVSGNDINALGINNTDFELTGFATYDANANPESLYVAFPSTETGLQYITYTVTDENGCEAEQLYGVFLNDQLFMDFEPAEVADANAHCVDDSVEITLSGFEDNPEDVIYYVFISCDEAPSNGVPADLVTPVYVYNTNPPPSIFFIPDHPSCGCVDDEFHVTTYIEHPCTNGLDQIEDISFEVAMTADEYFTATDTMVCINSPIIFNWEGGTITGSPQCNVYIDWQITDPNGNNVASGFTDGGVQMSYAFTVPGIYTISLDVLNELCPNVGDEFSMEVCVFPVINSASINLNMDWGIPAGILCAPEMILPQINSYNNQLCSAPDFTWRLYALPNTTTPVATYTGLSPDIPVNTKGQYRLILTVQVENCGNVTYQQDFTVAAPPAITITNPIFNACSSNSICLDDLFCIDTCYSSLSAFSIRVFNGIVSCTSPAGVPVYQSSALPQNQMLHPCNNLPGCQYEWTLPANPGSTYTIVINAINGCGNAPSQCITVNIGQALTANLPDSVCVGSPLNLPSYFPAGETGCGFQSWNGSEWVAISGTTNITGQTILLLSCNTSCPLQDTIHVFPSFTIDAIVNPSPLCGGDNAVITVNSTPVNTVIDTYSFSSGGVLQSGSSNTYTTAALSNSTSYNILATDTHGCSASITADVVVENIPAFTCNGFSFCESNTNATINLSTLLQFDNSYPVAASWTIGGNTIAGTSITIAQILAMFPMSGVNQTLILEYTLTTDAGCNYSGNCDVIIEYQGTVTTLTEDICSGENFINVQPANGQYMMNDLPLSAGNDFAGNTFSWTPLPSDTGSYTLQFNSGCSITNIPLIVHSFTVLASASDLEICSDSTVTLGAQIIPANTIILSYQWNSEAVNPDPEYSPILTTSANFEITAIDQFGCEQTDDIYIEVEELPIFNCNPLLASYCETSDAVINLQSLLSFSGSYPAGTTWEICGNTVAGTSISIADIVSLCGPVTVDSDYILSYQLVTINGCTHEGFCLIHLENEDLGIENHYLCSGATFNAPGNGDWNSDDLPASAPGNGPSNGYEWEIPTNTPQDEYILYYSAGCGVTEYHIHVYSTPILNITLDDDQLCIEANIAVTTQPFSADSFGYTYVNSDGEINLGSSLANFSPGEWLITNTEAAQICQWAVSEYVLPDNTSLVCEATECEDIDIIDIPGIPTAAEELCFEEAFEIIGDFDSFELTLGGMTYNSNFIIIDDLSGNQQYELTITYGGVDYGCIEDTTSTLYIHEPIEYETNFESNECSGIALVDITILQGENLIYTFSGDAQIVGGGEITEGLNTLQFNTNILDDTTYPFSITIDNDGCNTEIWNNEITVYASPDLIMDISATSVLCNGEEVCLDVVNTGSSSVSDIIFDMGNGTVFNFLPEPVEIPCTIYSAQLSEVIYTVTGILVGVCVTDTATIEIAIQPSDVMVILEEYPDGFCPGDTIDLSPASISGSGPFNIQYEFVPDINPYFVDQYNAIIPYGFSDENIIITISLDGACGNDDDIASAYIKLMPQTEAFASPLCQNVPVIFTNTSAPLMGEFTWHVIGETEISGTINYEYTFPDDSQYEVVLTQQIEDQCPGIDTLEVDIHELPEPEIGFLKNCYKFGYESVTAFSDIGYSEYTWDIAGDLYNTASHLITFAPDSIIAENDSLLEIHLRVVDEFGCTGTDVNSIYPCEDPDLFVPNCFTPDYDGINDVFCVTGVNISNFEMWIYDRWGVEVFYSKSLSHCWTGNFRGGEYFVPDGVYIWRIEYDRTGPVIRNKPLDGKDRQENAEIEVGHVSILR